MEQRTEDVVQRTLLILVVVGLMVACFWVLRPFLLATVWAAILVLASWRLMLAIQRRVGGSRLAASLIMTTVLLILVIVPFGLATHLILDNLDAIAGWVRAAVTAPLPPPPAWLADIPSSDLGPPRPGRSSRRPGSAMSCRCSCPTPGR